MTPVCMDIEALLTTDSIWQCEKMKAGLLLVCSALRHVKGWGQYMRGSWILKQLRFNLKLAIRVFVVVTALNLHGYNIMTGVSYSFLKKISERLNADVVTAFNQNPSHQEGCWWIDMGRKAKRQHSECQTQITFYLLVAGSAGGENYFRKVRYKWVVLRSWRFRCAHIWCEARLGGC